MLWKSKSILECLTTVIWAGEPGQDGGGLYREFLLYEMVHTESLNALVQGVSLSLFFTNYPEGIIKKWPFTLGFL